MNLGIDYASVDGDTPPNLKLARAAGLRFAIVRGSYSTWADPTAARDRDAIRAAGLTFGAYLFPVTTVKAPTPEEQVAAFVLAAGLDRSRDFAPVIDLEWPGGLARTGRSRAELAEWTARAVGALRQAYGCRPIVYSSTRVLMGADADALAGAAQHAIEGCPLWLARYPYKTRIEARFTTYEQLTPPPTPSGDPDGWWAHQFQGDALHFPGFSATVDLDRLNTLDAGAKGPRVAWVQERLRIAADGAFGPVTELALKAFQASRGVEQSGRVDAATFAALSWLS
jgi:GH25 family lysozyme M1 (1,4-beta-N-acetylmuramidase)